MHCNWVTLLNPPLIFSTKALLWTYEKYNERQIPGHIRYRHSFFADYCLRKRIKRQTLLKYIRVKYYSSFCSSWNGVWWAVIKCQQLLSSIIIKCYEIISTAFGLVLQTKKCTHFDTIPVLLVALYVLIISTSEI